MRHICTLRVVVSKPLLRVILAGLVLSSMAMVSGSETVSVTLYYPPPIAAYQKLGAKDYIRIGSPSGVTFFMGDLDKAAATKDIGIGILIRSANLAINMNSCLNCALGNQKSAIQFMTRSVGSMQLVGAAAFGNVCSWRAGVTNPLAYGALTPSSPLTLLGLGNTNGDGTWSMRPDGTGAGFWCKSDALVSTSLLEMPEP